jgi:DNA-binding transcriptional ArsR family regulator
MDYERLSAVLSMMASQPRLQLVGVLRSHGQATSVVRLAELTGMPRLTASYHLKLLRGAGIVRAQRDGNSLLHTLCAESLAIVEDWLYPLVTEDAESSATGAAG